MSAGMIWPPPRRSWPARCTPTRDGWVRHYRGRTRWVCGRGVPLELVEDEWFKVKRGIDSGAPIERRGGLTYREVLSAFLDSCERRVTTGKPRPMSARTLHNYMVDLNALGSFAYDGVKVADLSITEANSPDILTAYARSFGGWRSSGWDSVVSRVSALFRWAVRMEYLDRFRPGPQFVRPPKQSIRDDRLGTAKSFTAEQVAKLYAIATGQMKCWIELGICAAFIPSDIAHLTHDVLDLDAGLIDFRRRKTGKVRRIIPLPPEIVADLRAYQRAHPADPNDDRLVFLTADGLPWNRTGKSDKPNSSISRLFYGLAEAAEIQKRRGQGFSALRTTFRNLAPVSGYDMEREIIMGHAQGSIDLDHYLERVHLDRLRFVVDCVWGQVREWL
jgi:integrase